MADIDLAFISKQIEQILVEMHDTRNQLRAIHDELILTQRDLLRRHLEAKK
jgi:hypothetical protein